MTQNRIRIVDVADTLGLSSMASKESNPSLTTIHQEANLRQILNQIQHYYILKIPLALFFTTCQIFSFLRERFFEYFSPKVKTAWQDWQ